MKYIENATLCFLFMLEHSQVSPVVDATHSPRKKTLEAAKTIGRIAAFSIRSNELILAGDVFIIISPQPPSPPPHTQSCFRARWLSGIVLEMRSNGSGFETHWRHCIESLSKTFDLCLSAG